MKLVEMKSLLIAQDKCINAMVGKVNQHNLAIQALQQTTRSMCEFLEAHGASVDIHEIDDKGKRKKPNK